jgi:uracil DNA glycosylase
MANDLNIYDLLSQQSTQDKHDKFITDYLADNLSLAGTVHDVVVTKLCKVIKRKRWLNQPKVEFALHKIDAGVNRIQRLALLILVTRFPATWPAMFEAAFELLCSILTVIKEVGITVVYPPKWTSAVFSVERLLAPDEVKGVIYGIDPLSKPTNDWRFKATGYAFVFNGCPAGAADEASTTKGLRDVYGLKSTNLTDLASHKSNFSKTFGIAMINFIRTIPEGKRSAGSENLFRFAWIKYNRAWLQTLMILQTAPTLTGSHVLIFQNTKYPFHEYSSVEDTDFVKVCELLQKAIRCVHPSHIIAQLDHCLAVPKLQSVDGDKNLDRFLSYLHQFTNKSNLLAVEELLQCPCTKSTCKYVKSDDSLYIINIANMYINQS